VQAVFRPVCEALFGVKAKHSGHAQCHERLRDIAGRRATYCILDTASGRLDIASTLFKLADLVVFPVQASEDDLTAAPTTVRNIKAAGKPFLFVLTRVKAGTLITAQAAAILSKHG
jgi:hypothetical protein